MWISVFSRKMVFIKEQSKHFTSPRNPFSHVLQTSEWLKISQTLKLLWLPKYNFWKINNRKKNISMKSANEALNHCHLVSIKLQVLWYSEALQYISFGILQCIPHVHWRLFWIEEDDKNIIVLIITVNNNNNIENADPTSAHVVYVDRSTEHLVSTYSFPSHV